MKNLDIISDNNLEILDTYALKNYRKKNEIFIPFDKDSMKNIEKNEQLNNNDINDNDLDTKNNIKKNQKQHKINVNIEEFLIEESNKYKDEKILKDSKDSKDSKDNVFMLVPEYIEKEKTKNNLNLIDNIGKSSNNSLNKFLKDATEFLDDNQSEDILVKNQDVILLLNEIYSYLFDTLETLSLVHNDYIDVFKEIEKVKFFQPIKMPNKINVEQFLLNFRKTNSLGVKINLLASALGNYNLHMIIDRFKSSGDFFNYTKDSFIADLNSDYNGTLYDVEYLKEFLHIVRGDLSGIYIFNELKEDNKTNLNQNINKKKNKKKNK